MTTRAGGVRKAGLASNSAELLSALAIADSMLNEFGQTQIKTTMAGLIAGSKHKIKTLADAPCQKMQSFGLAGPCIPPTGEKNAIQIGTQSLLH